MSAGSNRPPLQRAVLALLVAFIASAPSSAPPPGGAVEGLDLSRFGGRWYVIASRGVPVAGPGAYLDYERIGDLAIRETSGARHGAADPDARARTGQVDPAQPARWIFRSGWFGAEERRVLYVSPDYRYAVETDASAAEMWILSRERRLPEWSYAGLIARLALSGVDVRGLERVEQPGP